MLVNRSTSVLVWRSHDSKPDTLTASTEIWALKSYRSVLAKLQRMHLSLSLARYLVSTRLQHTSTNLALPIGLLGARLDRLGFCVARHDEIQQFQSEPFWTLDVEIERAGHVLSIEWVRGRVFNRQVADMFDLLVRNHPVKYVSSSHTSYQLSPLMSI
jgi:hypothetical protein